MNKSWIYAVIPAIIFIILGILIVSLFLVKFMWSWTIPDLFPGAVSQGLIAREISWLTSFKVALFVSLLSGMMNASVQDNKEK